MLGVPLDTRIRRVLAVTLGEDLALTIGETPSGYFPAHLAQPQGESSVLDGSPRTSLPSRTLYWQGAVAPLGASHRIEDLDGTVYELVAKPQPVTNGRGVAGYSASVLPIEQLYPRSAELHANRGDDVIAEVHCAIFSERQNDGGRGTTHDDFCELPPSAWLDLDGLQNPELHFDDGSVWRLSEASLSREVPYVTGSARKAA